MSRTYDNWERLVVATLKKEQLRLIALGQSRETSFSSIQSDFTSDSPRHDHPAEASRIHSNTIDSEPGYPFEVQLMAFKELKDATENFRSGLQIRGGGFGNVYKGWINDHTLTAAKPGNGMAVAVKKWNPNGEQGRIVVFQVFQKEIHYMKWLHHPNLIKLIGFSYDDDNMLLVYELMPNRTLEDHLFRRLPQTLSWVTRINIAIGAARGLSFLHDGEIHLIHQNVTASNILLDAEFNAKLSDFGIAKDVPIRVRTRVSSEDMGTYGYFAPEYVATGRYSAKCDVYSFGVVLLELLSGRCAVDKTVVLVNQNLVDWAKPYMGDKRKLFRIMDTKLEGQYPQKAAYSVASIALQCLSHEPKLRPRMAEVLATLEQLQATKNAT